MFKLCRKTCRAVAVALIVSMLSLFIWSASSSSHITVPHAHDGEVSAHVSDEELEDFSHASHGKKHTHKHNAGDHTHDIPLRPVGPRYSLALFTESRAWHFVDFRSITHLPPERPPKHTIVA